MRKSGCSGGDVSLTKTGREIGRASTSNNKNWDDDEHVERALTFFKRCSRVRIDKSVSCCEKTFERRESMCGSSCSGGMASINERVEGVMSCEKTSGIRRRCASIVVVSAKNEKIKSSSPESSVEWLTMKSMNWGM